MVLSARASIGVAAPRPPSSRHPLCGCLSAKLSPGCDHAFRHPIGGVERGAIATLDSRIGGVEMRRYRVAPPGVVKWAAVGARDSLERFRRDPNRRRDHRHVARQRFERRQTEALSVGWNEHRIRRIDEQGNLGRIYIHEHE